MKQRERKLQNERQKNNCSSALSRLQQTFSFSFLFFPSKQLVREPLCSALQPATEAHPENTDPKLAVHTSAQLFFRFFYSSNLIL